MIRFANGSARTLWLLSVLIGIAVWQVSVVLHGQTLPSDVEEFPQPTNNERDVDAHPLDAQLAVAALHVPEGFRVDLFAAEPDVQNPIGLAWDARGRLWIAENYTYSDRTERFDLDLRDRVLIFSDSDNDGHFDERKVFIDSVQMLTSVEVGHGGVWLMCPSQLLFVPDVDHNDEPDGPVQVVLDGFEVAKENYHNFANGLRFGPDGWLYGRCGGSCPGRIGPPGTPIQARVALEGGIWRYHPTRKTFEVLMHGTTNPWGHDWNSVGEGFFINTVNGHLWQMIPGAHYQRPFTLDPNPRVYELMQMHADHLHFDAGKGWQASRDGSASNLGGGHAHCGAMIYLGEQWPTSFRDSLFTLNFHGRRANHEVLLREGSGYVAQHATDLFVSDDPFFRGMELSYGPDGSVFVIDWSDTGECHDHTGVHRTSGRIFRICYPSNSKGDAGEPFDLWQQSFSQLVDYQFTNNEWLARQARLVLAEKIAQGRIQSPEETRRLIEKIESEDSAIAVKSLLTLHILRATSVDLLISHLTHSNEHVRAWAVRLLTEHWLIDDCYGPNPALNEIDETGDAKLELHMPHLIRMASEDSSSLVRLAVASTLQRLPLSYRLALATALCARAEDANDANLPLLVWYGLIPVIDVDAIGMAEFAIQCQWPKTQRFVSRRIAEDSLANPEGVSALLARLPADNLSTASAIQNILAGVSDGLRGWRKVPQPATWPAMAVQLHRLENESINQRVRELSVVFGDGRALQEIKQIVGNDKEEIGLRRSSLEALVSQGNEDVREICLPLLSDARLNGAAVVGLARYDDPAIAREIIRAYRRFRAPERPKVIAVLTSRRAFVDELLNAVEVESIPVADLTPFDARQIRSMNDEVLNARLSKLWGETHDSSEEKLERMKQLKELLSKPNQIAQDLQKGRELFNQSCAKCHRLFGQGETIGPELTGANRTSIDYLLENVVDPSAVVSKDFCMSVVMLDDGRVLNGLITVKTDQVLTLQTQTELQTLDLSTVERIQATALSPMPDGLLDALTDEQIRNLIAYLQSPQQIALPDGAPGG
jgi:putative membrane-bound dehydrogenase-like protein